VAQRREIAGQVLRHLFGIVHRVDLSPTAWTALWNDWDSASMIEPSTPEAI